MPQATPNLPPPPPPPRFPVVRRVRSTVQPPEPAIQSAERPAPFTPPRRLPAPPPAPPLPPPPCLEGADLRSPADVWHPESYLIGALVRLYGWRVIEPGLIRRCRREPHVNAADPTATEAA